MKIIEKTVNAKIAIMRFVSLNGKVTSLLSSGILSADISQILNL